uniref:Uncharacterized protein n=1 Tax=Rhizophora mucronata TaxID=61149 RepID=A0A2P2IVK8_RHIMU
MNVCCCRFVQFVR